MGGGPMGGAPGGMGATPMGAVSGPPMGGAPAAGGGSPWMKWAGIGCGVLILLSCLSWAGCYACSMAATSAVGGVGGPTCARAAECCQAYVTQLGAGAAGTDCSVYNNSVEFACQAGIDTYRQSLQGMGQAVPPSCQ
jgi:hypothetical protein